MTKILMLIGLLFIGCKNKDSQSSSKDSDAIEEKLLKTEQTGLQETKYNEIEKILLLFSEEDWRFQSFCDIDTDDDIISLIRDGKNVDTLVLNNKEDSLFINLRNLLTTARIDSSFVFGYDKCICDTIYVCYNVTNNPEIGYIKIRTLGKTKTAVLRTDTDTIFKDTPLYEKVSEGLYKDIALGETMTKTVFNLIFSENRKYFEGKYMIIYLRNNDCVSKDTIILGTSNQMVLNSFRAISDSALYKAVVDSIEKRLSLPRLNNGVE